MRIFGVGTDLVADTRRQFRDDGFILFKDFFSAAEMRELLKEIVDGGRVSRVAGDSVLNNDTDKMFFTHNLYRVSPYLQKFASQSKIVEKLRLLLGPSSWMRWDHAIEKESGGECFPWHQDNAYSELKNGGVHLWIAVTDSKEEHGGLVFQRGSHKKGLLPYRQEGNHRVCHEKVGEVVSLSCLSGDVVFFSPFALHHVRPNKSHEKRWVYVLEYMSQHHEDPRIPAPYFMVSNRGKSDPRFVETFWAKENFMNRIKSYRKLKAVQAIRHSLRRAYTLASGAVKAARLR